MKGVPERGVTGRGPPVGLFQRVKKRSVQKPVKLLVFPSVLVKETREETVMGGPRKRRLNRRRPAGSDATASGQFGACICQNKRGKGGKEVGAVERVWVNGV